MHQPKSITITFLGRITGISQVSSYESEIQLHPLEMETSLKTSLFPDKISARYDFSLIKTDENGVAPVAPEASWVIQPSLMTATIAIIICKKKLYQFKKKGKCSFKLKHRTVKTNIFKYRDFCRMVGNKLSEGRLQTAEHILVRTVEHNFPDSRFIISTFEEESGQIEVYAETDLRKIDLAKLQADVNKIIQKNLQVTKHIIQREEAENEYDLTRLPSSVKEVRIVEIEGFDETPCKDPHVENTNQIGHFEILKVKKTGRNSYRFVFKVG